MIQTASLWSLRSVAVALVAAYILLTCLSAIWASPTYDELYFIGAGIHQWLTGRTDAYAVNPPLVRLLGALPVMMLGSNTDFGYVHLTVASRPELFFGSRLAELNPGQVGRLVFAARLAAIAISATGACVVLLWAKQLYGHTAGVVACMLWCISPMMLAHGSLITADVGAATFGVMAFYALRIWLLYRDWGATCAVGIIAGLAISSKMTWLPIIPLCFLAIWGVCRFVDRDPTRRLRREILQITLIACTILLTVNMFYAFDRSFRPLGSIQFISSTLAPMSDQPSDAPNRFTGTWIGMIPMPLPQCLLQGIDSQKSDFESDDYSDSYLMGNWKRGGWWYYYVIGLLIKSPLPMLILLVGAIARSMSSSNSARVKLGEGDTTAPWPMWLEHLLLLLPAVGLFALVSAETGFNRHLRYVLPAYPFVFIFVSQVANVRRPGLKRLVKVLLILQAVSVLWHGPHWLSYFNEAAGGPKRGGEWMLDSNVDWGQDFYYLRDWQSRHPEARPFKLGAYASCNPQLLGVVSDGTPTDVELQELRPGWYAVSVNFLNGHGLAVQAPEAYAKLKVLTPTDWAGYSICIYNISGSSTPDVEK